jgi:hypothetical protein
MDASTPAATSRSRRTSRSTDPSRLLPRDAVTATGDCATGAVLGAL